MTALLAGLTLLAADLTKDDLRRLASLQVSDEAILLVVRAAGPVEPLSAADLLELRRAGLSARVVEYLATTSSPPLIDRAPLSRTPSLYWPPPPAEVLPPGRPYWRHSRRIPRR